MGRKEWLLFSWTGRLSEGVPNFASQIDPLSPYQGGQIPQKEVTLLLCGFPKSLGHYLTLNSWIYALYESVSRKLWSPNGLSEAVASTIGVKQGCPLSPTLFGLYIDEVSDYIERFGGLGAWLAGIAIHMLLYADDIVLKSNSLEGLQRQLNAL